MCCPASSAVMEYRADQALLLALRCHDVTPSHTSSSWLMREPKRQLDMARGGRWMVVDSGSWSSAVPGTLECSHQAGE